MSVTHLPKQPGRSIGQIAQSVRRAMRDNNLGGWHTLDIAGDWQAKYNSRERLLEMTYYDGDNFVTEWHVSPDCKRLGFKHMFQLSNWKRIIQDETRKCAHYAKAMEVMAQIAEIHHE